MKPMNPCKGVGGFRDSCWPRMVIWPGGGFRLLTGNYQLGVLLGEFMGRLNDFLDALGI